jgi:predicted nucleic acid-binding protein
MIILDTNVVSALMRRDPDPVVIGWLDRQPPESVWITAVSVFEVHYGLELLAQGRRRRRLENAFARALEEDFDGRILPFEQSAARAAAVIAARRRQGGHPIEIRDAQIAGIAASRRATLATRKTRHFTDLGIVLIDPWAARP